MQAYNKLAGNVTIINLKKIPNSYKEPTTNSKMLLDCSKMWICGYKFPTVSFYCLCGMMKLCFTTLQGTVSRFLGVLKQ